MSAFDLIIFDCDGVLIESEIIAVHVESALFRERGADISPEEVIRRYVGTSEAFMYGDVEDRFGIAIDRTEIRSAFDAKFWPLAESELTAIAGVSDFIGSFAHRKCVCSNSSYHHIHRCLEITGLRNFDSAHLFAAKDHGAGSPLRTFSCMPPRSLTLTRLAASSSRTARPASKGDEPPAWSLPVTSAEATAPTGTRIVSGTQAPKLRRRSGVMSTSSSRVDHRQVGHFAPTQINSATSQSAGATPPPEQYS